MKTYMTLQQALNLMSGATSLTHWNELREQVKSAINPDEKIRICSIIDTEGLIVKTLRKNKQILK